MEEVTDPQELAQAHAQRKQFERNWQWSKSLTTEFWDQHRGRHVCIAGQEVFVDDTVQEAVRRARQAHPNDEGYYFLYIPLRKAPRIDAHSWVVASVR